jgi:hypothetical protein
MAKNPQDNTVVIEDATIIFRNFSGKEGQYNREGDRNFAVLLPEPVAQEMATDGWNVKWLKAREEGEEEQAYLSVSVNFKGRPPTIKMITSKGSTTLHEDDIDVLDFVDIETIDMILNPYEWSVNGKSGVKAYLQSIYVTIREDRLALKYNSLDDLPARAGRTIEGDE